MTTATDRLKNAIDLREISAVADLLTDDPNLVSTFHPEDRPWGQELWLPIHLAARAGDISLLTMLLHKKANADSRTRFQTPLHARETALSIACRSGHGHVVEALLEAGAEPEVRDAGNDSPLAHAARGGFYEIVDSLIEKRVSIDPVDDQMRTPLHLAILGGGDPSPGAVPPTSIIDHHACAVALVMAGADVNHRCPRDPDGYTPLHRCVTQGDSSLATAKCLLTHGAQTRHPDPRFGHTAHDLAKDLHRPAFVALLEAHDAVER